MSSENVHINFLGFFNENTTIAEIREIFRKERLLDKIIFNDLGEHTTKVKRPVLLASAAFLTGIDVRTRRDKGTESRQGYDIAETFGYKANTGAWVHGVFGGIWGATYYEDYSKLDQYDEKIKPILTLFEDISANRSTLTAGDVYQKIADEKFWNGTYVGCKDGRIYDLEIARENLLSFMKNPEEYQEIQQIWEKKSETKNKPSGKRERTRNAVVSMPTDPTQRKLVDLINHGQYQIILTGAPGAGKTYAAEEVAKLYLQDNVNSYTLCKVQFHPSYDYTDFVEGLRPVEVVDSSDDNTSHDKSCGKGNGAKEMQFRRVDGSFMHFCRYVAWQNEKRKNNASEMGEDSQTDDDSNLYFFIIDEINRADLSKVFGELMYAIEKRGKTVSTQYSNLETFFIKDEDKQRAKADPYYETCFNATDDSGFFIPPNVVIIGTMNDIDRSVESMDFAMRRRFAWVNVDVDKKLLTSAFKSGNFGALAKKHASKLAKAIVDFNKELHMPTDKDQKTDIHQLSPDYDISQGQFSGIAEMDFNDSLKNLMDWVWKYRVAPLLKEYYRGRVNDVEDAVNILKKFWIIEEDSSNSAEGQKNNGENDDSDVDEPQEQDAGDGGMNADEPPKEDQADAAANKGAE